MNKFYAGIGSRKSSRFIQSGMTALAIILNERGYTLRSGNATGSDQAFAKGVKDEKAQIWLPWDNFEINFQKDHPNHDYRVISEDDKEAFDSVDTFHPNASHLMAGVRMLMARNYRQVVGSNGEPDSAFVICWTENGNEVGGTAQAIKIAKSRDIPVFNLHNLSESEVMKKIDQLELLY